eukprot:TRINITY_DN63575_c0_g1_i1.p1 TRINITY_DN63575_c0_g1~~TRINITY_DN63575_c0_g1_i1.p1  ORF type:complete len:568 (+),score=110.56 TRINITY_DN63575_c0_g1_i1:118-1821(+)
MKAAPDDESAEGEGKVAAQLRSEVETGRMTGTDPAEDAVVSRLQECLALRAKFMDGAVAGLDELTEPYVGPIFPDALEALAKLKDVFEDPIVRKFCVKQLKLNEHAFEMYALQHGNLELQQMGSEAAGESFFSVAKVDSHLHLSACMTTPELFEYMQEIYDKHGHREIQARDGSTTTISKMMDAEGFTPGNVDQDRLGTVATAVMKRNFEAFNAAFQPLSSKPLKDLIFKHSRTLDGEFLLLFIKKVVDKAKARNTFLEPRISIKGRKKGEWESLAKWVYRHQDQLVRPHLLWAVQLPRVYQVHKTRDQVKSFGELMSNFFGPLFEATMEPEAHKELAWFLEHCGVIDTVDNEDKPDGYELDALPPASDYTSATNPPYGYYHFYFWANLQALDKLRVGKGMRSLTLRPHCGEAGPVHHLASAFLFAHNISHGINLIHEPTLEYLYYVAQVGLSVSPMSNKALFIPYTSNPFALFFKRGLCVTLTTDDPLMFHMTPTPLLEEYASARLVWGLTMVDLCEIAHHSVHISSLSQQQKLQLGSRDLAASNVPQVRWAFREQVLERNKRALS